MARLNLAHTSCQAAPADSTVLWQKIQLQESLLLLLLLLLLLRTPHLLLRTLLPPALQVAPILPLCLPCVLCGGSRALPVPGTCAAWLDRRRQVNRMSERVLHGWHGAHVILPAWPVCFDLDPWPWPLTLPEYEKLHKQLEGGPMSGLGAWPNTCKEHCTDVLTA